MDESKDFVTIRFNTSRASMVGCFYQDVLYEVPEAFARQVVGVEGVAEYVVPQSVAQKIKPTNMHRKSIR